VKIFKYLVSLVTNTSKQNFMFCWPCILV
jgi:hypothetical protein